LCWSSMNAAWCGSFGVSMAGGIVRPWRHLPLRRPAPGPVEPEASAQGQFKLAMCWAVPE
jgi:hypothetical protein